MMGILDVILVINIVLKLLNLITWSWWAVLWPLWAVLIIAYFLILGDD